MKKYIAIVSKSDATGGGASKIAAGLVDLLNANGQFEAHHWVGLAGPNANWSTYKLHGGQWLSNVQGSFSIASRAIGFPDFFTPELLIHRLKRTVDYSLYHFHDITHTFSPLALNWLAERKPVVWTMHDCSPFTGGCIAPMECQAFRNRCNHCPQISEMPVKSGIDLTGAIQAYKARMLAKKSITLISPSQWLIQQANASHGFSLCPQHIPNYVNTEIFRPIDKRLVRKALGLPEDQFIVLMCATGLGERHKGTILGIEALRKFKDKLFVVALGKKERTTDAHFEEFQHVLPGYIYNQQLLAQYFAAADVFLFPTLADSFGLVAIEAMASGTPPIAFATGGVPEIIDHDSNGWLAESGNVDALSEGIEIAINDQVRRLSWADHGLRTVQLKYTPSAFLDAHLDLYNKILLSPTR